MSAPPPPSPRIELDDIPDPSPVTLRELQGRLQPGGVLQVLRPRRPRRLARRLQPYFEGHPVAGKRFSRVRAEGGQIQAYRRGPGLQLGHFDHLADEYAGEIPPHLVRHYLQRKVEQLRTALGGATPRLGLDVGCGVGLYSQAVAAELDCAIVGVDACLPALRAANGPNVAGADIQHLPFPDHTFDFAYAINVVHHLKRGEQERALAEVARVLRPGAPLVVFEINTRNPVFRFYMRKVFPRTRRIDRGDEEFLTPGELAAISPRPLERVHYSTFIPDFVPRWSLPFLRPVERLLERIIGPWSIHYAAVFRNE